MCNSTNTTDEYSVIGYDKDSDVFIHFCKCETLELAIEKAKKLLKFIEKDELKREDNEESIDWIEVYWNWDKDDEKLLWRAYSDAGCFCEN